ncbi:hypothetical protein [Coralloluteibacterium thermophilus]|uniref:Uncharacterized protein n=1 Tax=Coralloluteibacterium thermophilum TaxID=2707049 RepID=A0ABV9NNZ7_9GAMM
MPLNPEQKDAVVGSMREAIENDPSVAPDQRDALLRHFEHILEAADTESQSTAQSPDMQWMAALDDAGGELSADQRSEIARELNELAALAQSPEIRLANEFAERCRRDGEPTAREWLKGALAQQAAQERREPVLDDPVAARLWAERR